MTTAPADLITAERALVLLRAAVAQRGADYRYSDTYGEVIRCRYVVDGCPACLIGVVLHAAGFTVEQMAGWKKLSHDSDLQARSLYRTEPRISREAAKILGAAQLVQDANRTWGEALAAAESAYEEGL